MTPPSDPIAAVTHPDPYPYYADLVARRPLSRDDALGLWVASTADAVTAVLTSAVCRVRPRAEPVPTPLVGSPAGAIFGRLVRMNDGARHGPLKQAVTATLESLEAGRVGEVSRRWARELADDLSPHAEPSRITDFASRLTASVVASLLGVASHVVPRAVDWTADFVRGLAPGSAAVDVQRGSAAAAHLLETSATVMRASADGLLSTLARHATGEEVAANALGFLSQAYDATTGLIGNTLLALARSADLRRAVLRDRGLLPALLGEVLRHDPPIQNTRRFVADDAVVAGVEMKAGDTILVLLAAANRDPGANPDPGRFDIARTAPRMFTFGVGPHACPGTALATTIAAAGVDALIASGVALARLSETVSYRPSANARIPVFGTEREPSSA